MLENLNDNLIDIKSLLEKLVEQTTAIREKLEEIKGYGICNSVSDICDKLDSIECALAENSCN